jgi:PAT family acetyl-CoA transporter-like MFS transporter 1
MRELILILLLAKIGFQADETITGLKLLDLGFSREYLALTALIDFPLQLIFGYYVAKWSAGNHPLKPWIFGLSGKLVTAVMGMMLVYYYPQDELSTFYIVLIMAVTIFSSFLSTISSVSMGSFFVQIADPLIGGTYMTLLNTLSNMGGTWPKYFILLAVDHLTDNQCSSKNIDGLPFKCSDDKSKILCQSLSGKCTLKYDGYYFVNTACVTIGIITLLFWIKPAIRRLERLPKSSWKIASKVE